LIIGVPRETLDGEKRVGLVPESIAKMKGVQIHVQTGAGENAGVTDAEFEKAGAVVEKDAETLYELSDLVVKVQPLGTSEAGM
jgi:NAD(P) transhydrogenase subunit alpha